MVTDICAAKTGVAGIIPPISNPLEYVGGVSMEIC